MISANRDVRADPVPRGPASVDGDVLTVDRLGVSVRDLSLVSGVSFTLRRGERVGLIGESGSGTCYCAERCGSTAWPPPWPACCAASLLA